MLHAGAEANETITLPQPNLVAAVEVAGDAPGENTDDLLYDEAGRAVADADGAVLILR